MADQLATPEDLAVLHERDDLDLSKATMLAEIGTAVVQAAAGRIPQRILQVVDDTFELRTYPGQEIVLPQGRVTAVSAIRLDGVALTFGSDLKRFGSTLWRRCGWTVCSEPSTLDGIYTHGYVSGHQRLQLARFTVIGLVRGVVENAGGATQVRIDDYSAMYDAMSARMEASPFLQRSLQRAYGNNTSGTI